MSKLDDFCTDLQQKIYADTEKEFGTEFMSRWLNPRFAGRVENPTKVVTTKPSCGKNLEISLRLENNRVVEIAFFTDGCGSDVVCAEVACELALNKSKEDILNLSPEDIFKVVPKLALKSSGAAKAPIEALKKVFEED
ncbi:MAG: nitrogen fixation protein NifU [Desulfonauticus sp.]|jgi:nitrogen fixation NifU-like protein|nr:MAG: Iron-sulfur cluster assembly protein, NifU-like [Desulfonauticus sp. 38_4375]MDK2921500.1 nitrogen fixation protein NifU [Desulfonauticus sp.]